MVNILSQKSTEWFVYMIKSSDDSLYTGITTDVGRRWNEHNGSVKGAKYFRGRKPQAIVFVSKQLDRSVATKFEIKIKKLKREDKIELLSSSQNEITVYDLKLRNNDFETR
jgi:putative endonuclease